MYVYILHLELNRRGNRPCCAARCGFHETILDTSELGLWKIDDSRRLYKSPLLPRDPFKPEHFEIVSYRDSFFKTTSLVYPPFYGLLEETPSQWLTT
jgi:hypothetical protein